MACDAFLLGTSLVCSRKYGYVFFAANIGSANRSGAKKSGGISNGKETLRLRSKGPASVEVVSAA